MEATKVTHSVDLGELDGAIVFRPTGVEVMLPNLPNDAMELPEHLYAAIALITKLKDEEFLRTTIDALHKKVDEYNAQKVQKDN